MIITNVKVSDLFEISGRKLDDDIIKQLQTDIKGALSLYTLDIQSAEHYADIYYVKRENFQMLKDVWELV
ncbi:MAG: hypothetical protein IJ899_20960 [Blautia sp.]|nr:hypothetical protein [Blautia sp.]